MIRLLPLLLLLSIVAGCASSRGTGDGASRAPSASVTREATSAQEPWRKDWRAFWAAVEPYAREGKIEDNRHAIEFNRVFSGEVEWTGTLKSLHSNGYGNSVVIEMPQVLVPRP